MDECTRFQTADQLKIVISNSFFMTVQLFENESVIYNHKRFLKNTKKILSPNIRDTFPL